jgi:hypothetical protein
VIWYRVYFIGDDGQFISVAELQAKDDDKR